ncbi:hypothetical protein Agub_g14475 [Astrephomene gubernaculifera]|uniref:Lysine--tRNA ligase n=1 Tax=Astrephomene gubernaculifera TaxID=47775 RepID=A0AAD3E403_9CHLO|nr:hypothetical protein Agub_g14475 [Astrephomene gubernaculifera]
MLSGNLTTGTMRVMPHAEPQLRQCIPFQSRLRITKVPLRPSLAQHTSSHEKPSYRPAASGVATVSKQGKGPKSSDNKATQSASSPDEVRNVRLKKVADLRGQGQEPYAYRFDRTHYTKELQEQHAGLAAGAEDASGAVVAVAGRVMAKRVMGKLAFLSLRDDKGQIQLYVEKARLETSQPGGFEVVKGLVDVGDIVGCSGGVRRTERGELSVVAEGVQVLTKSLQPLPDKWHGLADVEKRYRQRYLDMIMAAEVRDTFRARSLIISTLRRQLEERDFLEVETPVLESVAGGADARPFRTFHNSLRRDFTLRIATELHLKRLVVGGFERVFELGRIFRNEGVSSRHNPEFTSVEIYQAYADYDDMMSLTEQLIRACARAVCGSTQLTYQGTPLDFGPPFRRASMAELVREACGLDLEPAIMAAAAEREGAEGGTAEGEGAAALAEAKAAAEAVLAAHPDREVVKALPKVRSAPSLGHLLNVLFEALVESRLTQPTFVTQHPTDISPLAKPHRSKPGVTERFELFIVGREHANSYSELTDPQEQRRRFQQQLERHNGARAAAAAAAAAAAVQQDEGSEASSNGGEGVSSSRPSQAQGGTHGSAAAAAGSDTSAKEDEDYEISMDDDFITALEYGMPPTGGLGIGVDRLVMLLTDSPSIRDVIAFPLMK